MVLVSDGGPRGIIWRYERVRTALHVGASVAALARATTPSSSAAQDHALQMLEHTFILFKL